MTGIYKITSPIGMCYIGQSRNISKRWKVHGGKKSLHGRVGDSFMCYAKAAHKFEVIHELPYDVSQLVLNNYERFYIQKYKDCGFPLINDTIGGHSWLTHQHSQEAKNKISIAHKGRVWSASQMVNVIKSVTERNKQRKGIRIKPFIEKPVYINPSGLENGNARILLHKQYGIFCTLRDAAKMLSMPEQVLWHKLNSYRGATNNTEFIYTQ